MKKFITTLLIAVTFALAPTKSKATNVEYVYREVQSVLYGIYGGSAEGIQIGNWMLQGYGITVWDLWTAWDGGYYGSIEDIWTYYY